MIREYEIIKIQIQHSGEDDEEAVALVRDVNTCDDFFVVINDYFYDHYSKHVWGIYNKLQNNDRIKGELIFINCHKTVLNSNRYFVQEGVVTSMFTKIHYPLLFSSSFRGQFEVIEMENDIPIRVKYPYGDYDIRVDENRMLIVKSNEVGLRGELYLETVGDSWKEETQTGK